MSWDTNYYKTYIPSAALSISFTCAYATLTTGHFALFRRENVNFGVILVTAGLLQVAGHIARTVTHYHPNNLIAYSVQLLILLLGPNLFVIVAFIFAGQLGQYAIPGKATFQRRWMAFNAVLMFFNVAAMFLQIFGGVRLVQPLLGQSATYGEWIAAGGLGLQALLLMMFVGAIVGTAKYREKRVVVPGMMGGISSSTMMASACFVCLVLAASNIAKVVVFAYPKSVLGRSDWSTYAFGSAPGVVFMLVSAVWHMVEGGEIDTAQFIGATGLAKNVPLQRMGQNQAHVPA